MCVQIKDNEFLQRENLLLESYLAKVDLVKIGISMEEDSAKVRRAPPLLKFCYDDAIAAVGHLSDERYHFCEVHSCSQLHTGLARNLADKSWVSHVVPELSHIHFTYCTSYNSFLLQNFPYLPLHVCRKKRAPGRARWKSKARSHSRS
jgi:hypothetical protein